VPAIAFTAFYLAVAYATTVFLARDAQVEADMIGFSALFFGGISGALSLVFFQVRTLNWPRGKRVRLACALGVACSCLFYLCYASYALRVPFAVALLGGIATSAGCVLVFTQGRPTAV
jgi:hypothetical protein